MAELNEALKQVAVIGAAGKMGSGISLLLLQAMASQEAQIYGDVGMNDYRLVLVDANDQMLNQLHHYLRSQLKKFAERSINKLREWFASNLKLVDNEQIVTAFVEGAFANIRFGSSLEDAKGASLVFEAIIENVEAKAQLLARLNQICDKGTFYFTNTSSIPISILAEKSQLGDRLIGYHFYNPPAVQKLLEIIIPEKIDRELVTLSSDLAKRLEKKSVFSKDIAGFIGNGYFIREIAFTLLKVKKLTEAMPLTDAITLINEVTQQYLIRPMGIFQLIDYVGIDVCRYILTVMKAYIPDLAIDQQLIDRMVDKKNFGGQTSNGMQKDGFFHYEKNIPTEVFDLEDAKYIPLPQIPEKLLGSPPKECLRWKFLSKDPQKKQRLELYFQNLSQENTFGANLAKDFLIESQQIAQTLLKGGVISTIQDLTIVLENGFFHLYGPDAVFFPKQANVGNKS